jgi:Flagellar basal body-associated protein FliL
MLGAVHDLVKSIKLTDTTLPDQRDKPVTTGMSGLCAVDRVAPKVYVEMLDHFRRIFAEETSIPGLKYCRSRNRVASMYLVVRSKRSALGIVAAAVVGLAIVGCKPRTAYEFDALDLTPAQDELSEFSLGHYSIPIPIVASDGSKDGESRNRLQLTFDLYALVAPSYESEIHESWERHEGNVRDNVIRVCRNASLEELQEPELATLKSHLIDAIQDQLGPKSIHRLLISEVATREL